MLSRRSVAVATIVALALLVVGIGMLLPAEHIATTSRTFATGPETVWTVLTDFEALPQWREAVDGVERQPDIDGLPAWTEDWSGERLDFRVLSWEVDRRLEIEMTGEGSPGPGRWTFTLTTEDSVTRVDLTERGEIANPAARFIARFVMGHAATMERYLDELEAYLAAS